MSSESEDEDSVIAPFPDKDEPKPSPGAAGGGGGVNEGGKGKGGAAGSKDAAGGGNGEDDPAMRMDDLESSGGSDPPDGKGGEGAGPKDGGTAAKGGDEGGEGQQDGGGEGGEEEMGGAGRNKPMNRRVSEISESGKSLARSEDSEDGNDSRPQSAGGEEGEAEEPMSEEELKEYQEKSFASLTLQRVARGHVDRRRAAHTPVWCSYPMPQGTTGWSYSLPMGSLATADIDKLGHADRLEMLATVLEEGIASLPDQDAPTTDRPFAAVRLRKDLVRDLVVWCCETTIGYLDQAFPQPAIFLLTSVDTLCAMCESPLGLKSKAQFQGCGNVHLWALDRMAMIRFRASEFYESLELLDRALAVYEASAGAVGRLPFVLVQSHRACCFTMLSQHETALRTLELLLPAFSSVAMLPMGKHATLLDAHDVIAHGLVVAVHNTAVSLTYLGRHDEAKNARVRSLSLLSADDFPQQPMGRLLSYAYSACLHPSMPPELPHIVRPQAQKNSDRSVSFTDSNKLAETGGSGAGHGAAASGSWRRWLAVVGEGDNLAPVWLHCPAPPARAKQQVLDEFKDQATEVEKGLLKASAELSTQNHLVISATASAPDAGAGGNGAIKQAGAAGDEVSIDLGVSAIEPVPREEGEIAGELSFVAELDELVADDLEASAALERGRGETSAENEEEKVPMTAKRVVGKSGSASEVEDHLERLCNHALQGGGGLATASEVLKLLSPSVYPDCGKLSWGAHVYALSTMAGVLYVEERDWRGAEGYAEQAASVAQEEGGVAKKHAAYCRLQAAACAFRLGNYAKAFSLGKEALGYTQVVTEDEAQDDDVRRSLEDVVTAGCHVMALSHLNLGTSKTALALSKTAVEHIKGSSFADKSGPDFARVYRGHQIAMSMKQLTSVKSSVQALTTRRGAGGSTWTATRSKLDPNLFVPGALANNLPSSGPRWRSGRSSGSATPDGFGPESLITSQLDGLEHEAEASPSGPRYKWTGKYAEWEEKAPPPPGKAELDYEEPPDKVTLSELKAVLPRSPLAKGLLRDAKPVDRSSARSTAGDNGHGGTSLMSSKNRAAAPGQRVLKIEGVTNRRSASAEPLPAHRDVAVTLTHWGPEEEKARTLTTARSALNSSRMYFAQTMSRGKTRVESPLPNSAPLQKDGRIPPQLGSRPSTVMRDWGPDPTSSLLSLSRGIASKMRGKSDTGGGASATKVKRHGEEGGAKSEPVTVGTNVVRIGKHDPYDTVTRGSLLSLFGQPGTRRELVREMEARSGIIVKDMEWTRQLPDIRDKAMTRHEERAERERKDVSLSRRPFYWSHPPEESVYSHGPKSTSNKSYRALPYGTTLTPAAKLAYGAAPMTPSIGNRSSGGVVVDSSAMLEYADLTRKSPVAGGFKASRNLTSFY